MDHLAQRLDANRLAIARGLALGFVGASFVCLQPSAWGFALSEAESLAWVVKHVCVDHADRALPADPYDGCPDGSRMRLVKRGEALPYRNHDQPMPGKPDGLIYKDNVPILDAYGRQQILSTIDWVEPTPGPAFKPYRDGFDLLMIADGWVSLLETHSKHEFSTTFFGPSCEALNGIVFFPLHQELTSGKIRQPIAPVHWEQLGQPFPGGCRADKINRDVLTTWEFVKDFDFGGVGGAKTKTMDAIVVTMGYQRRPAFLKSGHLETFYFTKMYGLTRWEGWISAERQPQSDASKTCAGESTRSYQGVEFVIDSCRDYSATTIVHPAFEPPPWPASLRNVLRNFHFGDDLANWHTTNRGASNAHVDSSKLPEDIAMAKDSAGLRYLSWSCSEECQGQDAIYQDIPVKALHGKAFDVGIIGRVSEGSGEVIVTLQFLDADDNVQSSTSLNLLLKKTAFQGRYDGRTSKVFASHFVTAPVALAPLAAAQNLRFCISPKGNATFEIVSAWLMPR